MLQLKASLKTGIGRCSDSSIISPYKRLTQASLAFCHYAILFIQFSYDAGQSLV